MPSTVIRSFLYDAARRELDIVFQSNRSYTYFEVPPETYIAMKESFAKGEFFNERIRGNFSFRRNADLLVQKTASVGVRDVKSQLPSHMPRRER